MSENQPDLRLDEVATSLHQALSAASTAWTSLLNDRLLSITVVGSCLTADYRSGQSDINTVLVVDKITPNLLDAVSSTMRSLSRKQRMAIPLLMTEDYIARSRDVFGIEFLDFQLTHKTVFGQDPFTDLSFSPADVRLQCERELKADLIRLRQGFITAQGKDALIAEVLIAGVKSLLPLCRAMLWLEGQPREATLDTTFNQAAKHYTFDVSVLQNVMAWRQSKARPKGPAIREAFEHVYALIDSLAGAVDRLGDSS